MRGVGGRDNDSGKGVDGLLARRSVLEELGPDSEREMSSR